MTVCDVKCVDSIGVCVSAAHGIALAVSVATSAGLKLQGSQCGLVALVKRGTAFCAGVLYFHNDIDTRPDSADERKRCLENGWAIDDPAELQRWRDQEPINAHSHLLAMLLGSTECIPVSDGRVVLGQWQSVMLVDLDGPRDRTVGLQVTGYK